MRLRRCLLAILTIGGIAVTLPALAQPAAAPLAAAAQQAQPLWNTLTPAQQQILAPLAEEWNDLEAFRKKKWLEIAARYPSMKPEEQQRLQQKMRDWVKLTPEQRRAVRESYARTQKLAPEQKSSKWEEYQQLPDEKKKELATAVPQKKPVTTLPAKPTNSAPLPTIKDTPKPVLQQSVTPQATTQSNIPPAQPAAKP